MEDIEINCPHCDESSHISINDVGDATTFKSMIGKVAIVTENNLDQQVAEEIGRVWGKVKPLDLIEILKGL